MKKLYLTLTVIMLLALLPQTGHADEALKKLNQAVQSFIADDYTATNKALDELVAMDNKEDDKSPSDLILLGFFAKCDCFNNLKEKLDSWQLATPNIAYPYFYKALYYQDLAWIERGVDSGRNVEKEAWIKFEYNLEIADNNLNKALELNDSIPSFYSLKIQMQRTRIVSSRGILPDEFFDIAIQKFPNHGVFYRKRMTQLDPKWGGSRVAMRTFAGKYGRSFPQGHMNHFLPLRASLVLDKQEICFGKRKGCDVKMHEYFTSKEMKELFISSLKKLKSDDLYNYEMYLEKIDSHYKKYPKTAKILVSYLEEVLGKDNYIVSRAYGALAEYNRNYSEVIRHQQKALKQLQNTAFENDYYKDLITARLNYDIGYAHYKLKQYKQAQEKAEIAVKLEPEIKNHRWLLCSASKYAKAYEAAVRNCRSYFEQTGQYSGLSNAAYAHSKLQQYPQAANAYEEVGQNGSDKDAHLAYRSLGFLYMSKPDFRKSVEYYSKAFEIKSSGYKEDHWDWNNRCWGYINLGEYKKALNDCEMALSLNPSNSKAAANKATAERAVEE